MQMGGYMPLMRPETAESKASEKGNNMATEQYGEHWYYNYNTNKYNYTYHCESTNEQFECECKTITACRAKRNKWVLENDNRW